MLDAGARLEVEVDHGTTPAGLRQRTDRGQVGESEVSEYNGSGEVVDKLAQDLGYLSSSPRSASTASRTARRSLSLRAVPLPV